MKDEKRRWTISRVRRQENIYQFNAGQIIDMKNKNAVLDFRMSCLINRRDWLAKNVQQNNCQEKPVAVQTQYFQKHFYNEYNLMCLDQFLRHHWGVEIFYLVYWRSYPGSRTFILWAQKEKHCNDFSYLSNSGRKFLALRSNALKLTMNKNIAMNSLRIFANITVFYMNSQHSMLLSNMDYLKMQMNRLLKRLGAWSIWQNVINIFGVKRCSLPRISKIKYLWTVWEEQNLIKFGADTSQMFRECPYLDALHTCYVKELKGRNFRQNRLKKYLLGILKQKNFKLFKTNIQKNHISSHAKFEKLRVMVNRNIAKKLSGCDVENFNCDKDSL